MMKRILIAFGLLAAATLQASAQSQGYVPAYGSDQALGVADDYAPGRQAAGARVIRVNAPGGAYIDCDPRNPQSPVRCTPDGW
jgi:hypothetical protein